MKKSEKMRDSGSQPSRHDRYAQLALATLRRSDISIAQMRAISLLVANMIRCPAVTRDERQEERITLDLLFETVERYQSDAEQWRELADIVVCDARRLPLACLDADEALRMMNGATLTRSAPATL